MKRATLGGTTRGPVAPARQRRTLRLVQAILVLIAAGLLTFAGYSWGRVSGFDDGRRSGSFDAPRAPSGFQTVALVALGAIALGAAVALQGDGTVRAPSPARLEELAGRAEEVAVAKAEQEARRGSSG